MTIGMCIFLGILYVLIGAFVGYCMFSEDVEGIMLGILIWPLFIVVMLVYIILELLLKFVGATVNGFKKLCDILLDKSKLSAKDSLGLGTDEKEHFTKCDRCPLLKDCRDLGRVIDVTGTSDSRLHYILQFGETCDRGIFHWDYDAEEEKKELSEESEDKR